jgi:hypothetical protein
MPGVRRTGKLSYDLLLRWTRDALGDWKHERWMTGPISTMAWPTSDIWACGANSWAPHSYR